MSESFSYSYNLIIMPNYQCNHCHSLLFCPQDKVTKVSVITALIVAAVANILLVVGATIAWNNCKLIHILVH